MEKGKTYAALPRRVPRVPPALVERDEEVGAAVSVGDGEAGIPHLLAGRFCSSRQFAVSRARAGRSIERPRRGSGLGVFNVRRGSEAVSEAISVVQLASGSVMLEGCRELGERGIVDVGDAVRDKVGSLWGLTFQARRLANGGLHKSQRAPGAHRAITEASPGHRLVTACPGHVHRSISQRRIDSFRRILYFLIFAGVSC